MITIEGEGDQDQDGNSGLGKDVTRKEGRTWEKIEKELWEDRWRGLVVRQHIKWKHLRRRRKKKKNVEAEELILKHDVLT
jgi:hypothetical protein